MYFQTVLIDNKTLWVELNWNWNPYPEQILTQCQFDSQARLNETFSAKPLPDLLSTEYTGTHLIKTWTEWQNVQ